MLANNAPNTSTAIADPARRTNRLTIPLTDVQSELVEATARRLGWSKATLAREAVFRFTAAVEASRALADPTGPLLSLIPAEEAAAARR